MKVSTQRDVVEFIRAHGGTLYVWADLLRCIGPKCTFFHASLEAPREPHEFRRFVGGEFDLFFSDEGLEAPPELRLVLAGRRRKRVSVYEGYSWVTADEPPQTPERGR
jgi:hypothetical protein